MPTNSIIDHGNTHALAMKYAAAAAAGGRFPTASFDEMSAASSAREDFLLVLISSTSGSPTQVKNQNRALTIVEACGVQPEVLDASDPANALVRDELCDMSGIRGRFPQFFLVQGDRTSFFCRLCRIGAHERRGDARRVAGDGTSYRKAKCSC